MLVPVWFRRAWLLLSFVIYNFTYISKGGSNLRWPKLQNTGFGMTEYDSGHFSKMKYNNNKTILHRGKLFSTHGLNKSMHRNSLSSITETDSWRKRLIKMRYYINAFSKINALKLYCLSKDYFNKKNFQIQLCVLYYQMNSFGT